jgi:hypothetical protein
MKTVTDTPERLVIEDAPMGIGLLAVGVMAINCMIGIGMVAAGQPWGGGTFILGGIFAGLLLLWLFARHTQVWLDRGTGVAALRVRTIFGYREKSFPLSDLKRAETCMSRGAQGQYLYGPALVFGGQTKTKLPIIDPYTSKPTAEVTTATINAWLARRA